MSGSGEQITKSLTFKFVFALSLLAALALANWLILRTEILQSHNMALVVNSSSRQQMLLHRTAMLAERLIFAAGESERLRVRGDLLSAINPLEATHYDLMRRDEFWSPAPEKVREIYEDSPWLLDSEMRNYVLHLRSIANASEDELRYDNVHFSYIRNPQTFDKILGGLDAIVDVYKNRSEAKSSQLRLLATWSLLSTLAVLLLDGWFVFRPMVRRVRDDVRELNEFNATLENRVAERTAEAERRAELLARSEAALRDSEALYRSLVKHLPMCVLRKDREGRFLFANDRFCELNGRSAAEVVGKTDADFYPPEMAAKFQNDDLRVMQSQRLFQSTERHRTPDGRELYVEVLKSALHDAEGNVIGTQTAFWDVTDRKLAEQRAIHSERLAAIGQMVAGVAHESRNALQQIQACSRLLEWELDGDAPKKDLLADLQTALDRLHRLFDELRSYASPLKLDVRPCDLRNVFVEAWAAIEPQREGRNVTFHELGIDDVVRTYADPFQLHQVLRNILENAVAAGDDPLTIEVEFRSAMLGDAPAVQIAVRDNGPGLSEEQRKRVFEPFFTTKTQGAGLGMAITRQIVEAHGGAIEAGNGRLGGAEFVITLPHLSAPSDWTTEDENMIGRHYA